VLSSGAPFLKQGLLAKLDQKHLMLNAKFCLQKWNKGHACRLQPIHAAFAGSAEPTKSLN
jgi:hypothetical protein